MGENIDMQSGNLNFSVPLIKPIARGGWGPTVGLSYNSQIWRNDSSNQSWLLGEDVGYGLGWKLMAGSLETFRDSYWTVHHYLFTDGSGAEYRLDTWELDVSGRRIWRSSKDSTYVRYEEASRRLYFPDGTFWLMDSVAAGNEHDVGTRYPTVMQDRNGNQIKFRYDYGRGAGWENSSARITEVEDVRAQNYAPNKYRTYQFAYFIPAPIDPTSIPHLWTIRNSIDNTENYDFHYWNGNPLYSPFGATAFGQHSKLVAVISTNGPASETYQFVTNSSGELTQVFFP